jgi:bacterioferritin-associated ferredoxin
MSIVCFCNQVSDKEIKNVLKKNPSYGICEIKEVTLASTRCGKCLHEVTSIINSKIKNRDFTQLRLFS